MWNASLRSKNTDHAIKYRHHNGLMSVLAEVLRAQLLNQH